MRLALTPRRRVGTHRLDHRRPRNTQAVLAVIEDGLSVADVAEKVGVSRQTLHSWLSRYAGGGLERLSDRTHRPRSCPHQMDPSVEVRLVELRALHPGWGADRLRYRLEREGFDPVPSGGQPCAAAARAGHQPPAPAGSARVPPVGTRPADGAVADGRDGWGATRRWLGP
jgi:transposase